MTTGAKTLLIVEVAICFALPIIYLLPFGVLSLFIMVPWALMGESFAIFNSVVTISGCFGLVALTGAIRYLFTGKGQWFCSSWLFRISAVASVVSLWAVATNLFREFSFDIPTFWLAGLPTLATLHIIWLVQMRLHSTAT